MRKQNCYTANHSGGLKECIESQMKITYVTFLKLVSSGIYEFYGYDERIKAYRYILKDMQLNIGLPVWLHYYGKRKPI